MSLLDPTGFKELFPGGRIAHPKVCSAFICYKQNLNELTRDHSSTGPTEKFHWRRRGRQNNSLGVDLADSTVPVGVDWAYRAVPLALTGPTERFSLRWLSQQSSSIGVDWADRTVPLASTRPSEQFSWHRLGRRTSSLGCNWADRTVLWCLLDHQNSSLGVNWANRTGPFDYRQNSSLCVHRADRTVPLASTRPTEHFCIDGKSLYKSLRLMQHFSGSCEKDSIIQTIGIFRVSLCWKNRGIKSHACVLLLWSLYIGNTSHSIFNFLIYLTYWLNTNTGLSLN